MSINPDQLMIYEAQNEKLRDDSARLDWLIANTASVKVILD
jgi:hypothetical protein